MPKHGIFLVTDESGPRPISVLNTSVIGIVGTAPAADAAAFPLNKPVLISGSRRQAAKLDNTSDTSGGGTLLNAVTAILDQGGALIVVVRVAVGADDTETQNNVIGATLANGDRTGLQAFYDARTALGVWPRILLETGFSDIQAVATAGDIVAARLHARHFVDAPNTSPADAQTYRALFDSANMEMGYPALLNVKGDEVPWSAWRAGIEAAKDNNAAEGYSASGSNKVIRGTLGLSKPVDYQSGTESCTAAVLNNQQISTVINDGGFRTWGNRSLSSDPRWSFMAHAKVNSVILDSIGEALKWARDKKITKAFVEDIPESINIFLRSQKRLNHIAGGECFIDPELNEGSSILAGNLYVNYEWSPLGIAESIQITASYVDTYVNEII